MTNSDNNTIAVCILIHTLQIEICLNIIKDMIFNDKTRLI